MSSLSIGEVARRAGVTPSAMRHYERIGLLPAPPRVSGRRRYDEQALVRLGVIRLAQEAGFTLAEIRSFLSDLPGGSPSEHWRRAAQRKLADIDALIARAEATRRRLLALQECRCEGIGACVRAGAA